MSEPKLLKEFLPYPEILLNAWKNRGYSMLESSKASGYIKKILTHHGLFPTYEEISHLLSNGIG